MKTQGAAREELQQRDESEALVRGSGVRRMEDKSPKITGTVLGEPLPRARPAKEIRLAQGGRARPPNVSRLTRERNKEVGEAGRLKALVGVQPLVVQPSAAGRGSEIRSAVWLRRRLRPGVHAESNGRLSSRAGTVEH